MWKDRVLPLTDMTQKYPQSQIDALSSCLQTLAPLTFLSHFYINMTANIALKSLLALQVFFPVNLDPGKLALKRFLLLKPPEQEGGRAQPALPASGWAKFRTVQAAIPVHWMQQMESQGWKVIRGLLFLPPSVVLSPRRRLSVVWGRQENI